MDWISKFSLYNLKILFQSARLECVKYKPKHNDLIQQFRNLVKNGFFHIFTGTFLNKAVTMISSVVVARLVNKDQYAYLGYSDTIYGYLALFSGLGMGSALLKVCAGNTERKEDYSYLSYAIRCGIIFELIVSVVTIFLFVIIDIPFEQAKHYIIITSIYPTLYCLYDLLITYMRSKSFNKKYAYLNLAYSILTCVFSISFVLLFDAVGLIYARYLVIILLIGYLAQFTKNYFNETLNERLTIDMKIAFWKISLTLVVANAFSGMMPFNENMLISHIIAEESVLANYRVGNFFPQMILLVTQAVNVYFFPIVAGMDNQGKNVKRFSIRVGIFNFVLVIVSIAVGMLVTPALLPLLYGKKYADAVGISMMLWIMRGMNAGIRMVPMNMLIAIGEYRFNLILSIITFFAQIAVDWFFISKFGVYGVFMGTVVIYFITGVLYWVKFIRTSTLKGVAS